MSKRDISLYLLDIFIAIDKIKRYCKNFNNIEDLKYSEIAWDATIRELEIIGEAIKILIKNEVINAKDYRKIVDFRNLIVHKYFGINEEIVWDVIVNKLPILYTNLLDLVKKSDIDLESSIKLFKKEFEKYPLIIKFLDNLSKELK